MALTRPTGEQLVFDSTKTGQWSLDEYLENSERGVRTLAELISDLFDTAGALRQNISQFRISATRELESRFGTFVSPSVGWVGTGAYFPRYRGTWTSGVDYKQSDYAEYLGIVYLCTSDHTSTGVFDSSKFTTLINSPAVGALSNVTPAADTLAYYTSGTTAASTPITPYARSLLDDANSAAMRATLGFDADYVSKTLGTFQTMTSGLRSLGVLESTNISGLLATYGGAQAQLTSDALLFNGGAKYAAIAASATARITFGGFGSGVAQFSVPLGTVTVTKTAGGGAGLITTSVQFAGATFGATVTMTFTDPLTFNVTGAGTGNPTGLSYSPGMSLSFNGWTAVLTGTFATGDTYTFVGVPADVQRFGVTEAGLAAIGGSFSVASLSISNTLAGLGAQAQGVSAAPRIGTGTGTTTFSGFLSDPVLAAGFAGNIASLRHFNASAGSMTIGGGQTIAQEAGFYVGNLPLATERFGLYAGLVASGTAAWNVYAAGSAPNFFSGQVGVGDLPTGFSEKFVAKITGAGNTAVAAYDSEVTGVSTYRVSGTTRGEVRWTAATFTIGGTGATGLALTAGGSARLSIDTAGAVTIPGSLTIDGEGVSAFGFRNLLINPRFLVNQRGYVSGTAVGGGGVYTLDRWAVLNSGQSLSWVTDGFGNRVITAPAGGVQQIIEGSNIPSGDYTINWSGTAQVDIIGTSGGPFVNFAKGGTFTSLGGNVTIRFRSGTVSRPQVEPGRRASAFEIRFVGLELLLCQWYFRTLTVNAVSSGFVQDYTFPEMRVTPAVAPASGSWTGSPVFTALSSSVLRQTAYSTTSGTGVLWIGCEL